MTCVCGINAVLETLKAGSSRIERIYVQRGQKNRRVQEIIDLSRHEGIPLSFEERSWLDRRAGGERHQGILCYLAALPTYSVEGILDAAASPGLVLIIDGVEDPRNLGAILRSAEIAAADGIFLPERRTARLGAAMVKASAGAAAHVKVARAPNLAALIDLLKKRDYWVAGLAADAPEPIWQADFSVPTALVLGSEGSGIRRLLRDRCDFLFSIPVRGEVASYNVSVAAGIALYEVLRQRLMHEAPQRQASPRT